MSREIYPLSLRPVYRDYLWGGTRLAEQFGRRLPGAPCAESWEIADRPEGMSVVASGPLAGRTLAELVGSLGPRLTGSDAPHGPFPLLIKVIDAGRRTSLQVHPSEEQTQRTGGQPKTEMWLALEGTTPGAGVFLGLSGGLGREDFARALRDGRVEEVLRFLPLSAGDAVLVPAGVVHAIDAGCFLLEVQQNSDTTFRLYDWERTAADGKPRPLHMEQAWRTICWDAEPPAPRPPRQVWQGGTNSRWEVLSSPFFRVMQLRLGEPLPCANDGRSFHALFLQAGRLAVEGNGECLAMEPGMSALLPAALHAYTLLPGAPGVRVILVTL